MPETPIGSAKHDSSGEQKANGHSHHRHRRGSFSSRVRSATSARCTDPTASALQSAAAADRVGESGDHAARGEEQKSARNDRLASDPV